MPKLIVDHKAGYTLSKKFVEIFNNELDYPKFVKNYYDSRNTNNYKYKSIGKIFYQIVNNIFIKKIFFNKFLELKHFYIFNNINKKSEKYIAIIRDPREVIISGYLYHKNNIKCKEDWSINRNVNYFDFWLCNIDQKQFKNNIEFYNHAQKFSAMSTYQNKLNSMNTTKGIIYEMNNVAYITLKGFLNFKFFKNKNVKIVKFEDLIYNSEETISEICKYLNVDEFKKKKILKKMKKHCLLNINNDLPIHVTNLDLSKDRYKRYWNRKINKEFNLLFPSILNKLNY